MTDMAVTEIESVTRQALEAHGADPYPAGELARAVAWAEARGNRICGLAYLESYCRQLRTGRVDGTVTPKVTQPRPAEVRVDAGFGFAQPAFARGLGVAVEAAQAQGIARLAVAHAHTCTALGFFTEQIAQAGLIGLGFTNASPVVAPPGGRTRTLGTNPLAFAVSDGEGGVAMQLDQSTTAVALGHITAARAAGEPIPEGWALDSEGQPTTDPEAALAGSLLPLGGAEAGHKGWGLGLMVEVLSAGLTGSTWSRDVAPLKAPEGRPHDLGQFYILIDPAGTDGFADGMARLAARVAEEPGARLPGSRPQIAAQVEVPDALWSMARKLAEG